MSVDTVSLEIQVPTGPIEKGQRSLADLATAAEKAEAAARKLEAGAGG